MPKFTGLGEITRAPTFEALAVAAGVGLGELPPLEAVGVAVGALVIVPAADAVGEGDTSRGGVVAFTEVDGYGPTTAPCWQAVVQARKTTGVTLSRSKRTAFMYLVSVIRRLEYT